MRMITYQVNISWLILTQIEPTVSKYSGNLCLVMAELVE